VNTTFLSGKEIASLLDMKEVIRAVEDAFLNLGSGKAKMPPKIYLSLDEGDFRAMPAAIPGAAGVKWVNVHPHNPAQGLPTVMATLIYNDPATGYPLAVMDASLMTAYRHRGCFSYCIKIFKPEKHFLTWPDRRGQAGGNPMFSSYGAI